MVHNNLFKDCLLGGEGKAANRGLFTLSIGSFKNKLAFFFRAITTYVNILNRVYLPKLQNLCEFMAPFERESTLRKKKRK